MRVGVFGWIDWRFPEVAQCRDYEQDRILEGHEKHKGQCLHLLRICTVRLIEKGKTKLYFCLFVCLLLCCFVFVFCSFWTSFFWDFFSRKISHAVTLTIISWEFWDFLGVATLRVCYESILFMKHLSVVKSVLLLSQIYTLLHMKLLL